MKGVSRKVSKLRERMQERIPLGPLSEQLTPTEMRRKLAGMDYAAKQAYIEKVGDDEWRKMMDEVFRR